MSGVSQQVGGRDAVVRWLGALTTAPEGTAFEVGLTWDFAHGWRVYQRVGESFLLMAAREARNLADAYERIRRRPEWAGSGLDIFETLDELRSLATECHRKNRDGVLPSTEAGSA